MYRGLNIGAVVAAAGRSSRMGDGQNKQFLMLDGMPVLGRTLSSLSSCGLIDEIVVVMPEDEMEKCRRDIIDRYKIPKVIEIVKGGSERQQSIMAGLEALKDTCDIAVTHDGARPFVTDDIITQSIYEAYLYGAAACAVPIKDTIKVSDGDGFILDTPDRSTLYAVQTPQTFKFNLLYNAHLRAKEDGYTGTDDTVLVERLGAKVKLFAGSYENIKITTPEDIYMAYAIMRHQKDKKSPG